VTEERERKMHNKDIHTAQKFDGVLIYTSMKNCLRCDKKFKSFGKQNRICRACKDILKNRSGEYKLTSQMPDVDDEVVMTW
jgi:tRNA(Ile2) C34 agmatinyltransferase TiaS